MEIVVLCLQQYASAQWESSCSCQYRTVLGLSVIIFQKLHCNTKSCRVMMTKCLMSILKYVLFIENKSAEKCSSCNTGTQEILRNFVTFDIYSVEFLDLVFNWLTEAITHMAYRFSWLSSTLFDLTNTTTAPMKHIIFPHYDWLMCCLPNSTDLTMKIRLENFVIIIFYHNTRFYIVDLCIAAQFKKDKYGQTQYDLDSSVAARCLNCHKHSTTIPTLHRVLLK